MDSLEKTFKKDLERPRLLYDNADGHADKTPFSERSKHTLIGLDTVMEEYTTHYDEKHTSSSESTFEILRIMKYFLPPITAKFMDYFSAYQSTMLLSMIQRHMIDILLLFFNSRNPNGYEAQYAIKILRIMYLEPTGTDYNNQISLGLRRLNEVFSYPITNKCHIHNRLLILEFYGQIIIQVYPIYASAVNALLKVFINSKKYISESNKTEFEKYLHVKSQIFQHIEKHLADFEIDAFHKDDDELGLEYESINLSYLKLLKLKQTKDNFEEEKSSQFRIFNNIL